MVVLIASVSVLVHFLASNCLNPNSFIHFKTPNLSRLGVLLSALVSFSTFASDNCQPQGRLEAVRVERAVDGDTLALTDRRRVRLIGFNAPEKANKGRSAEPLASAAQTALSRLVAGKTIYLQKGQEERDRYGRLLAHAFRTAKGDSIEERMLREGWGFQVVVAPNKSHAECFAKAESVARSERRGVWANSHYRPVDAKAINAKTLGFMRVKGTVQSAELAKAALWLSLEGDVVLRINRDDLSLAGWPVSSKESVARWEGKSLTVRGWVTDRFPGRAAPKGRQRYVITLSHPAMIER